jgi:polar amino acid transport system substrate-binding protein
MKKLTSILALALALTLCFGLAACGAAQPAASDLDYVKANGKLIIGITDFAPMDYQDENGDWIGFDADMAVAFAESLGVEPVFQVIDWDNKIMELNGKTIDCVWNGMTLTDEVLSAMECSKPYMNNAQVVVMFADKIGSYSTVESLSGLVFAVEAGSSGEKVATELGLEVNAVQNQASALMEVAAGTSDAAIIDALMAAAMVGEGTGYENLTYSLPLNDEKYGVGFRKGSNLADELNAFLDACIADGSLLELAKLYSVQGALIGE